MFITRTSSLYILGKCKDTKYDSIHLHSAICSWEILLSSLCTCSYTLHQTDFSFMSKIITDHESWVSGCDLQSKQKFLTVRIPSAQRHCDKKYVCGFLSLGQTDNTGIRSGIWRRKYTKNEQLHVATGTCTTLEAIQHKSWPRLYSILGYLQI